MDKRSLNSLASFLEYIQIKSINFSLRFDAGRYIPGQFLFDTQGQPTSDEFQKEHVIQGQSGWLIEVDMRSYQDEAGNEKVYPTVKMALLAAIGLLREIKD